ncbi:MAG TPA: zinc ribbon domain-containing protein [Methylomirabilota bacterium]|nr:zinc ribbon domain-containing protein [Methylomirabilota bacterium]
MPPEVCPNCGAPVPGNARACPECGSDEQTGWSDRATGQRLNLPDDEFDYEEFVREEFGSPKGGSIRPRGVGWLWWTVAVILVVILAMLWARF